MRTDVADNEGLRLGDRVSMRMPMIHAPSTSPAAPQPDAPTGSTGLAALPSGVTDVLDAQALARLGELDPAGQAGLVQRVLRTFAASLDKLALQLGQARAAGDSDAIRHVAHTLRSSSASVGAVELARICAEIERRVRDGRTDGLAGLLDDMVDEIHRIARALAHLPAP